MQPIEIVNWNWNNDETSRYVYQLYHNVFFYPKDTAGSINCNSISSTIVIALMLVFNQL